MLILQKHKETARNKENPIHESNDHLMCQHQEEEIKRDKMDIEEEDSDDLDSNQEDEKQEFEDIEEFDEEDEPEEEEDEEDDGDGEDDREDPVDIVFFGGKDEYIDSGDEIDMDD